jgi:uncharacterized RDD family membrane protein YckC
MSEVTATLTSTETVNPKAFLIEKRDLARIKIQGSLTMIGRDHGIKFDGVSRKHCLIRCEDGEFMVADMNSRYGTYLNHQKLSPNEWQPLKPGDQLRLGTVGFHLQAVQPSRAIREEGAKLKPVENAFPEAHGNEPEPEMPAPPESAGSWPRLVAYLFNSLAGIPFAFLLAMLLRPRLGAVAWAETFLVLCFTSYVPMVLWSQTLGKKIIGLRVVMADGSPLSLGTIAFREILMKGGSLAILAALGFACAMMLNKEAILLPLIAGPALFVIKWRVDGMPFWDQICGTRVVKVEEEP